jgi:hypothetical protein
MPQFSRLRIGLMCYIKLEERSSLFFVLRVSVVNQIRIDLLISTDIDRIDLGLRRQPATPLFLVVVEARAAGHVESASRTARLRCCFRIPVRGDPRTRRWSR